MHMKAGPGTQTLHTGPRSRRGVCRSHVRPHSPCNPGSFRAGGTPGTGSVLTDVADERFGPMMVMYSPLAKGLDSTRIQIAATGTHLGTPGCQSEVGVAGRPLGGCAQRAAPWHTHLACVGVCHTARTRSCSATAPVQGSVHGGRLFRAWAPMYLARKMLRPDTKLPSTCGSRGRGWGGVAASPAPQAAGGPGSGA